MLACLFAAAEVVLSKKSPAFGFNFASYRDSAGGVFGEASRWRKTALRHLGNRNPL